MNFLNRALITTLTATLVMLLGLSAPVHAVTPAGGLVIEVHVSYDGNEGKVEEFSAGAVGLVLATPDLSGPVVEKEEVSENGANNFVYDFIITSRANGGDTYEIQLANEPDENAEFDSIEITQTRDGVAHVTQWFDLGATAAIKANNLGETFVTVASDGLADAEANKIMKGDLVVIQQKQYAVKSVDDNGITASIELASELETKVEVGDRVAERQHLNLEIKGASLKDSSLAATILTHVKVLVDDPTGVLDDPEEEHITSISFYKASDPEFAIYIVNASRLEGNLGAPAYHLTSPGVPPGGFMASNKVTALPNDILEYLIVQKAGTSDSLDNVVIKANIPPFTTYQTGSTTLNGVPQSDNMERSPLWVGNGLEVGTIPAFGSAEVIFKVKLDQSTVEESWPTLWVPGTTDKDVCWERDMTLTDTGDSAMCTEYGCWVEGTAEGVAYCYGLTEPTLEECQASLRSYVDETGVTKHPAEEPTSGTPNYESSWCSD